MSTFSGGPKDMFSNEDKAGPGTKSSLLMFPSSSPPISVVSGNEPWLLLHRVSLRPVVDGLDEDDEIL